MNNIGFTIRRTREQKGYSQEFMASQLNISQASFARIESQEIKLSIERLQKIADILETDILTLLDSSKNQMNHESAYSNKYIENLNIENQETLKKLIRTLENENEYLKKEIEFLKAIISTSAD